MRNYGRRYAIYASGWKDGTPDRSSNPSRTMETEKGEKGRRCTMIYSQLVDMIGHHRKDMSFFFLGRREKRDRRTTLVLTLVIEVATKAVELLYRCQISDAVNGIWLVVKAASLIPWTP